MLQPIDHNSNFCFPFSILYSNSKWIIIIINNNNLFYNNNFKQKFTNIYIIIYNFFKNISDLNNLFHYYYLIYNTNIIYYIVQDLSLKLFLFLQNIHNMENT